MFSCRGIRVLFWGGLSFLSSGQTARAATYNFFFNNVEQGKNGSASPQIVTNQEAQFPTGAATAKATSPMASSLAQELPSAYAAHGRFLRFRFGLSFSQIEDRRWNTWDVDKESGLTILGRDKLINASAAFFASKDLAINTWVGTSLGESHESYPWEKEKRPRQYIFAAELEFIPFHVEAFGHQDVFDLGARLGISMVDKTQVAQSQMAFSPHWAIAFGVNLNDHLQIASSFRSQVGQYKGTSFEAGLNYRI